PRSELGAAHRRTHGYAAHRDLDLPLQLGIVVGPRDLGREVSDLAWDSRQAARGSGLRRASAADAWPQRGRSTPQPPHRAEADRALSRAAARPSAAGASDSPQAE